MADQITIRLAGAAVLEKLQHIARQVDDMRPAMQSIGEIMMESTKQRFSDSRGPDGQRWAANAESTVLARLAQIKGAYTKQGKLSKKGSAAAMGKKPLVDTGMLQKTISYQVGADGQSVSIGTNRFSGEWTGGAAVHQFGSKDGSIPARPFLGMSNEDRREVLSILDRFARQAIEK